ncbi:MAG: hypothetical protein RBR69_06565 [Candidatus Cloacimonadaceae bacterium]|nr:hypothetical protein [Candidatus Cloacimonadota bacterium]MDY0127776.1 hypothetical protein [Candidatus Cloacimonadaceae bacterium]MCB5254658.1 hypothetical protein [Candidatus Cloacimonadota bacterium]MCK9178155.1 hypothetical protein [Candidatus Cloacimonadota bacterium]MCK9242022.1 hypothetical protein [Candidatus Cloacimonadota bacterium]
MKKVRLYTCEIKRHRQIAPELCAVCPRVTKCRAFRVWHQTHAREYLDFVLDIVSKFPEKYQMEVQFMNEKQHFVQIVDMETGKIDRIANLKEIDAMSPEEKLALSKNKNLFIVTHRLQPIVKVTLKKSVISKPIQFGLGLEDQPEPEPEPEVAPKAKEKKTPAPSAAKGKEKKAEPKSAAKAKENKPEPAAAPKGKPKKKS